MIKKLRTLGRAAARLRNYCARMAQPSLTQREKAFTLVELLIVIAIIAILTLAFLPNILKAPAKARDAIRLKQVSDIANAIEVYATEKGNPPPSDATGCFLPGLAETLGITAPDDSKKLNSCNVAAGNANVGRFYYRFKGDASPVFYIVATKLEASSASNTVATWALGGTTTAGVACNPVGINGVATLECAKSLTSIATPAPGATEFWRVAAGPQ